MGNVVRYECTLETREELAHARRGDIVRGNAQAAGVGRPGKGTMLPMGAPPGPVCQTPVDLLKSSRGRSPPRGGLAPGRLGRRMWGADRREGRKDGNALRRPR